MNEPDRHKLLFGPYRMPRCRVGRTLRCAIRGKVTMRGIREAPIQWPYTIRPKGGGRPMLILCGDLVRAVRRESETAICHWWGVGVTTVWTWRKALGVEFFTQGTVALKARNIGLHFDDAAKQKVIDSTQHPERNAKIAAARRGKPRPPHVIEAMREANLGRQLSNEQRRKMSEAHKRRGTRPPAAGVPWTPVEDALLVPLCRVGR